MKIGGMGYAILRVAAEQIRELHTVPADVVFERTLETEPSSFSTNVSGFWVQDEHPFYFRIRHRYLPRAPDRGPLVVFTLHELLRQMKDLAEHEEANRGKPVPEELRGQAWIDDDE